jgi:hypothetical protein
MRGKGQGATNTDRPTDRLTVRQAAERLGITEDAVRSRIKRGTLASEHHGGRVYVLVGDQGAIDQPDQPTAPFEAERIADLREQVAYLRDQLRREQDAHAEARRLLAGALERIPALEAPMEPSEATEPPEPLSETAHESERTSPPASTGAAQAATEGHSEAEPSLLRERVAVVTVSALPLILAIVLVLLLENSSPPVAMAVLIVLISLSFLVLPAVFGFRLGRKVRSLRFWHNVAPGAALLALLVAIPVTVKLVSMQLNLLATSRAAAVAAGVPPGDFRDVEWGAIVAVSALRAVMVAVPTSFAYSFAAVLGNASRRRRREKLMEDRPSEFPPEAASRPQGWTPRQQAIVGLTGTIISALIGLIGTILTVLANG